MRPSCSSPDELGVFPHGGALAADRSHHGARESACRLQRIVPIRHGRRSRQANASRVITVWMQVPMGAPGDVMNALHDNAWTRGWAALGQRLPRPRAVLSVSAHWYLPGTAVTAMAAPRTIHDFGGFPRELFEVQYPAPGDLGLVGRVRELLRPL